MSRDRETQFKEWVKSPGKTEQDRILTPLRHFFVIIVVTFGLMTIVGSGGCSGGGDSGTFVDSPVEGLEVETGIFVDSPVEGLEFKTATQSGLTDSEGTFQFREGKTITFSIGSIVLGETTGKSIITPVDLVEGASDETNPTVVNICRFLLSLDVDGNVEDCINISEQTRDILAGLPSIDFGQSVDAFANDLNVQTVFDALNDEQIFPETRNLCSAEEARGHLHDTLFVLNSAITLLSPNGGEVLIAGESFDITWQTDGNIDDVTILLSNDGGQTWNDTPLVSSTPDDGSYVWMDIPLYGQESDNRIRITDAIHTAVLDDSDAKFTIVPFTLNTLWEKLLASTAGDRDGDYLPDDIEELLGTNPDTGDSDKDDISDFIEVFGGGFNEGDPVPDLDEDGLIAALDNDDNNDGVNDGEGIDSDGDGIADYLEYYGYTYDWVWGQYLPWTEEDIKNDPTVLYFKTDPLQPSTDQDPYSDDMEATGILMDVAVNAPGDLPMVPAYPNIVVKLERYEVTLNADITTSTGKSLWNEENWNVTTEESHTHTDESHWEQSVSVSLSISDIFGASANASYSYGESYSDSITTGTVTSSGGSSLEMTDWQTAKSTNPIDTAHVKLYLKVYNYGTAPASSIIPTLTIRIGKRNIATFEPGNSQINMLEPGGVYPADPDVYWTVDTIDTGTGVIPLALTIDELRALETGAPVDINVTQILANVLTMDAEGHWESAGGWHEYMARVKSVCAKLFFDIGDGNIINYLVYADDSKSSPEVTLRDALLWVAGGFEESGQQKISYYDRIGGGMAEANLDGWSICMDGETWEMNDIAPGDNVLDTVLGPDTTVIFKAPGEMFPTIHYAYLDEQRRIVRTFVTDYRGISSVEFIEDLSADPLVIYEMTRDEGVGFYSCDLEDEYELSGQEAIRVTNVNEPPATVEESLAVIPDPSGIEPVIRSVTGDLNTHTVTACVDDNGGASIEGVFIEILGDPTFSMVPMIPQGTGEWAIELPCGMEHDTRYTLVYAINSLGYQTTSAITDELGYVNGYNGLTIGTGRAYDFETHTWQTFASYNDFLTQTHDYDIYMQQEYDMYGDGSHRAETFYLNTLNGCVALEMPEGYEFDCLTRDDLEAFAPLMVPNPFGVTNSYFMVQNPEGELYILYTGEHYVKIHFRYSVAYPSEFLRKNFRVFANP